MLATASGFTAALANTTRLDWLLRRILPGLSSAASVIPLFFVALIASEFPLHVLLGEALIAAGLLPRALRSRRGRAGSSNTCRVVARLAAGQSDRQAGGKGT